MMKLQQFSNIDDLKPAENVAHPVNTTAFAAYKKWMGELRSKLTVKPEEKTRLKNKELILTSLMCGKRLRKTKARHPNL
jgi:hypothetical protein